MNDRRTDGRETWNRLLHWDKGQTAAERLAATLLASEGYTDVDPSHPLGGKDGKKDILVTKDNLRLVVGVYMPRGQKDFTKKTMKKFREDLSGVKKNKADGFVFFTNQEVRLAERSKLHKLAGAAPLDLFHLERATTLLNTPQHYGTRLEFLNIAMTSEELIALYAQRDADHLRELSAVRTELEFAKETIVGYVTGGNSFITVTPASDMLLVGVEGDFPMRNVNLTVADMDGAARIVDEMNSDKVSGFSMQSLVANVRGAVLYSQTIDLLGTEKRVPIMPVPSATPGELKRLAVNADCPNGSISGVLYILNAATGPKWATVLRRKGQVVYDWPPETPKDEQGNPILS